MTIDWFSFLAGAAAAIMLIGVAAVALSMFFAGDEPVDERRELRRGNHDR